MQSKSGGVTKSVFLHSYALLIRHLVDARISAGITQVDLANRLGRPQSFVSKVESGDRRIDVIEFLQIIAALNVAHEPIIASVLAALVDDEVR